MRSPHKSHTTESPPNNFTNCVLHINLIPLNLLQIISPNAFSKIETAIHQGASHEIKFFFLQSSGFSGVWVPVPWLWPVSGFRFLAAIGCVIVLRQALGLKQRYNDLLFNGRFAGSQAEVTTTCFSTGRFEGLEQR